MKKERYFWGALFVLAGILFPLAFIVIIYDQELGITAITPWTVLIAALLGSIGLSIIFHKHMKWARYHHHCDDYEFEQGNFECSFGAMKIYFDHAVMKNASAVVKLDVSFAGVEIIYV